MRDESGAQRVAPDGSSLGIMPADSGGVATPPRAPGHDRPPAALLSAAGYDRPSATPRAPDHDVPLAVQSRAPGHDRPRAAHMVPDHDWSCAAPRAPGHDRPPAALLSAPGHDRPSATPRAPDHDVPLTGTAGAPGYDRPRAAHAPASAPDCPHVTPPAPPGHDCSRRAPAGAGPRPTSVTPPTPAAQGLYDRTFTAEEVQQFIQADGAPLLDQLAAVGRAVDVLQRTLKARQALAPDAPPALAQLLDEAAAFIEDVPAPAGPHASTEHDP